MKRKITVILLIVFLVSIFYFDTVQASASQNGKGVSNGEIEQIIENVKDDDAINQMSSKEIKNFLNTKNENALMGKSEEEGTELTGEYEI